MGIGQVRKFEPFLNQGGAAARYRTRRSSRRSPAALGRRLSRQMRLLTVELFGAVYPE
jgi:hypothetical protein